MNNAEPLVFIVDDEPDVLTAIARLMKSAGYKPVTFASPREFLDQQSNDAHGCVVLDLSMPGLNGLELQQALARKGISLPIVFLSGRADIPLSILAMKQGANDFLTKLAPDFSRQHGSNVL